MVIFGEKVINVSLHGEAACTRGVIPGDVNTSKFGASPVGSDGVVFLEGSQEVLGMSAIDVLDSKVVNNEDKHDRTPLMVP